MSYSANTYHLVHEGNAYLLWLRMRRPFPVRLEPGYSLLVWVVLVLPFLLPPIVHPISVALVFVVVPMAFVPTILDLLYFLPRAFHEDCVSHTGTQLLVAPIATRDIVSNLRLWGYSANLPRAIPLVFILVGVASIQHEDFLSLMLAFYLLHRFLLSTGLVLASLPGWVTYTGVCTILWIGTVLGGLCWLAGPLTSSLFDLWQLANVPRMEMQSTYPVPSVLSLSVLSLGLAATLAVMESWLPRLIEMRRRGAWS